MPTDHRRINGPEVSIPYRIFMKSEKKGTENVTLNSGGLRSDKRKSKEHRKIYIKCDIVSQAKGSAYIEVGNTKVIVSVFEPREIPNKNEYSINGELYCDFKYATFSCKKRRTYQQDAEEKECSSILKRALEPAVCRHEFPNFQIDIYALVLENDGSALSAAITCAGVALNQAGVCMYDIITAVTLGRQGDNVYVDPIYDEELLCNMVLDQDKTMYHDLKHEFCKVQKNSKSKKGKRKDATVRDELLEDSDDGLSKSDIQKLIKKYDDVLLIQNEQSEGRKEAKNVSQETAEGEDVLMVASGEGYTQNILDHGIVLISVLSTHQQITEVYQSGSISLEVLYEAMDLLMEINKEIVPLVQKCLVKYIQKNISDNTTPHE